MTASLEEIRDLVKIRQKFLGNVLQNVTEEKLNEQVRKDKRTVAEIMDHLFLQLKSSQVLFV